MTLFPDMSLFWYQMDVFAAPDNAKKFRQYQERSEGNFLFHQNCAKAGHPTHKQWALTFIRQYLAKDIAKLFSSHWQTLCSFKEINFSPDWRGCVAFRGVLKIPVWVHPCGSRGGMLCVREALSSMECDISHPTTDRYVSWKPFQTHSS